ncbi:alcohol dehydrogenase [Bradyrhizobium centrolobii]|uniref:Alcohol dehydrogenase 2 n=1 Tax=Bradyrhizobium centrolobii TaxID=1505087 RepID=A0A176YZW0_9BRAD|nr:iron-containing alcohol dehydrogenase [Bradyrhizobium centrolobii]OAF12310.1 alcohol dehydrogenase [Bradyrhizobium centrolobii]
MISSVLFPREMLVGGGAINQIGALLGRLALSRPLIVTDRFMVDSGLVGRLLGALHSAGLPEPRIFSEVLPDPTTGIVERGVSFLQADKHDCVIGFGGGSPIDTAKAISVLAHFGGPLRKFKAPHLQELPGLPILAIPTTAGTGSEATRFTVITDDETQEKMLCAGAAFLPIAAVVDYKLTLSKPARLTADTGIDALTHAIEAYVSRRANPFSDGMARLAMRAISPNLRTVYLDPANRQARESLMIGATQAGVAFSNSSVALVHGMSRPIGAHFHVPHGLSNAMLLPSVTAFSAPSAIARYADCARAMQLVPDSKDDDAAVGALLNELQWLNKELGVPSPAKYGIDREAWHRLIPTMTEQALASGSPANNPRAPSPDEIQAIYREIYD